MPRASPSALPIPPAAQQALRGLGGNLAIARVRRRESQRVWAKRLGISVPTLIRMERGDPGVGAGIYATALWLIGTVKGLSELAAPTADLGALEDDVRKAVARRTVRSAASVNARLGRQLATSWANSLASRRTLRSAGPASRWQRRRPIDRRTGSYLWLLTQPERPVIVGELNLVRATQGVSLRYADSWLRQRLSAQRRPAADRPGIPARRARIRRPVLSTMRGPTAGANG